MNLGLFLPLALAFISLTEIPLFLRWRANGMISEGQFPILILASLILPVAAYFILNLFVPEWGAIEVF